MVVIERKGDYSAARSAIEGTNEWKGLVEAVTKDEVLSSHIGRLIGGLGHGARQVTRDELTHGWVDRALEQASLTRSEFASALEATYLRYERELYADEVEQRLVAPLLGLDAETDVFPLRLDDEIEVDRLTDEEISLSLAARYIAPILADTFVGIGPLAGIRRTYSVPKSNESGRDGDPRPDVPAGVHRDNRVFTDVAAALRLAAAGHFTLRGALRYSPSIFQSGSYGFDGISAAASYPEHFGSESYKLTSRIASTVVEVWSKLRSSKTQRRAAVTTAVRRFNDSTERSRHDDRLVDLLIASEALFLPEDPDNRGELGYRLALRFSAFGSSADARSRYAFMREAYRLRSRVVHGGELSAQDLGRIHAVADTLTAELRPVIRELLNASVAVTKGPLIDWDDLVLAKLGRADSMDVNRR